MNQAQCAIKNKLDSMLLSAKYNSSDDARKLCLSMIGLTIEEQRELIKSHWGENCLNKVEPLLIQLESAKDA